MIEHFKNMDKKEFAIDLCVDFVGGILIALGLYNFAAAAVLPMAGVNGIALILYQLFGLPMGAVSLLINIPIILGTYRILGRRFFMNSLHTIVISSFLVDFVAPLFPVYTGDRFLSALTCAVLSGLGYAMIYMRDSSTGGVDFIMMSIRKKHPHLTVGGISFVIDAVIIVLGVLVVAGNMDSLLYGLINAYIMSFVIDKVMYGTDQGKVTLIVTDHGKEICEAIDENFERGSTILKGKGNYTEIDHDVILCACNNKQMYGIRKLVKQMDPKAFTVIMESSDVVGEGFKDQ